ncbi:surface carbohydrate biosynthesis protein [Gracilibacillus sp. D59]|uniref:surface carbohydrate biosynthesis protein n=1 Tax=Gracilibacillus sp. D59 TaxID=3457434 RepID=UPI003FCDEDB4
MKKNNKWIYLPVEQKVRELDAKLLLAYYAVIEGYDVVIGDHIMVELASGIYPKGIFFSKGYPHGFRKRIITNAKKNGHSVVELDEEGLLIQPKNYLRNRLRKELLQLVTQEYCWGHFQKEVITRANPEYKGKCYIVGNPRLDLLKPKFRSLYKKDAEKLINKYGDFILINTRFSRYNSKKGMKDNVYFKHIKKLYYKFIEMIKVMSEKFPDTNFVIRPHPGENFETYCQAFSVYKNVHVIHEGNIIKWLLAAKVVIHNGCTSGIEAFLLGKPVISYMPPISNKDEVNLPNKLGIKAANMEELHTELRDILHEKDKIKTDLNENDIDRNEKGLFHYCEWSTENYSYESILRLCNTIPLPPPVFEKVSLSKKLFHNKDVNGRQRFSLTEKEIQDFFNKLVEIEGESSRIMINKLGNNLFKIQEN